MPKMKTALFVADKGGGIILRGGDFNLYSED